MKFLSFHLIYPVYFGEMYKLPVFWFYGDVYFLLFSREAYGKINDNMFHYYYEYLTQAPE